MVKRSVTQIIPFVDIHFRVVPNELSYFRVFKSYRSHQCILTAFISKRGIDLPVFQATIDHENISAFNG